MDKLRNELEQTFGTQRVTQNEPLTPYLPSIELIAPLFITINSKQELLQLIQLSVLHHVPYYIIDQDSDTLEKLDSVTGIVVKNNARKFDVLARKGKIQSRKVITDYALIEAESGVPLSQLVRYTIEEGLGGIEELLGIAGTVGYALSTSQVSDAQSYIQSVTILTPNGTTEEISYDDLKKDLIVLSVIFKLVGEDTKILWYKARRAAEKRGSTEYSSL